MCTVVNYYGLSFVPKRRYNDFWVWLVIYFLYRFRKDPALPLNAKVIFSLIYLQDIKHYFEESLCKPTKIVCVFEFFQEDHSRFPDVVKSKRGYLQPSFLNQSIRCA